MCTATPQTESRRAGFSGVGALSVLLAAVIVLASSPTLIAGTLADPASQISRVGSQIRRLASAVPFRIQTRPATRDLHRPAVWANAMGRARPVLRISADGQVEGAGSAWGLGMPVHFVDLPPPALST